MEKKHVTKKAETRQTRMMTMVGVTADLPCWTRGNGNGDDGSSAATVTLVGKKCVRRIEKKRRAQTCAIGLKLPQGKY